MGDLSSIAFVDAAKSWSLFANRAPTQPGIRAFSQRLPTNERAREREERAVGSTMMSRMIPKVEYRNRVLRMEATLSVVKVRSVSRM